MASTKSTENKTLTQERSMACMQAAWELDALARMLPSQVRQDVGGEHLVIRGISARLITLASVLMSAMDEHEEMVPTADLEKRLLTHENEGAWI